MISLSASTAVAGRRVRGLTLAAACLALFAIFLDNTIVNVAIPAIQHDLGAAPDQLEWAVNAYVVAFAGLVLLGGKLGDRLGRRKMFVAGLLLFAAGSAAGGLSASSAMLIGSRTVQGAGAALLAPLSLSLLAQVFRRRELPMVIGIWTGVSGLGLAIGPLAGGLLVEHAGWHAVFWVNVPIAVLAAVLTLAGVPESADTSGNRIDVPGAALVTAGLVLAVAGFARHPVLPRRLHRGHVAGHRGRGDRPARRGRTRAGRRPPNGTARGHHPGATSRVRAPAGTPAPATRSGPAARQLTAGAPGTIRRPVMNTTHPSPPPRRPATGGNAVTATELTRRYGTGTTTVAPR